MCNNYDDDDYDYDSGSGIQEWSDWRVFFRTIKFPSFSLLFFHCMCNQVNILHLFLMIKEKYYDYHHNPNILNTCLLLLKEKRSLTIISSDRCELKFFFFWLKLTDRKWLISILLIIVDGFFFVGILCFVSDISFHNNDDFDWKKWAEKN